MNLILWDAYADYEILERDETIKVCTERKKRIESSEEIVSMPYGKGTTKSSYYKLEIC